MECCVHIVHQLASSVRFFPDLFYFSKEKGGDRCRKSKGDARSIPHIESIDGHGPRRPEQDFEAAETGCDMEWCLS